MTTNVEECGPYPVFASFTLAFALQLRKKHGKTSVRLRKTSNFPSEQLFYYLQCTQQNICYTVCTCIHNVCPSQLPHGLRRGSAAARLLGLRVRIPPGAYKGVSKSFETSSTDRQPMAVRKWVRCAWEQGTSPLSMPSGVAVWTLGVAQHDCLSPRVSSHFRLQHGRETGAERKHQILRETRQIWSGDFWNDMTCV